MRLSPADLSTNPTVIALRVAVYWIEASASSSIPAFDLGIAARSLRFALAHANRAKDNAAKAVAMRYLNKVRARIAAVA